MAQSLYFRRDVSPDWARREWPYCSTLGRFRRARTRLLRRWPYCGVVVASPALAQQAHTEDRIRTVLDSLVGERQELRRRGTDPAALEANRIGIVYWQQELSKRLSETSVR